MNSKTFLSILIMIFLVFIMITYYKMKDFPYNDNCCKDIKNPGSTICLKCNDYNLLEKIVYVWKYS